MVAKTTAGSRRNEPRSAHMENDRIAIRGTVTRDPELSTTNRGKLYTRINVAADEVSVGGRDVNPQDHKYQNIVFWGVDAVDKVSEVKQGAQVSVSGEHVVRQAEGRDGQMRTFSEIHHASLSIDRPPRDKVAGVAIEMKGEVLYEPELKAVPGSTGKFYTVITIRPENGSDRVRAPFFGDDAVELARAVRKGAQVSLKGELVEREYTNREGVQTKGLEVQKASMHIFGKDREAASPEESRSRHHEQELGG
jgi:single-stranded DNA-binding protein